MKTFVILHSLVAGSGHKVSVVLAETEEEALTKYHKVSPYLYGVQVTEVTEEVQEVFRYDDPGYEG